MAVQLAQASRRPNSTTILDVASEDGVEPTETGGSPPVPAQGSAPLPVPPFEDLIAPIPHAADPSPVARWIAFGGITAGGVLGLLIGYGIGDLMANSSIWAAAGALLGAIAGAVGVGIVANLALRAMGEWQETEHPERSEDAVRDVEETTSGDTTPGQPGGTGQPAPK